MQVAVGVKFFQIFKVQIMEQIFIQAFIPNASILKCSIGKGIHCYQKGDAIFVLANSAIGQPITKRRKDKAIEMLTHYGKRLICVSLFNKKSDLSEAAEIAWGSYVWFADNPKHSIHFDDNPKYLHLHKQ